MVTVVFLNYFTLTTFSLILLNIYVLYQRTIHDSEEDNSSFDIYAQFILVGSFVLPLVIQSLNVGILAGAQGQGKILRVWVVS